jgi:beta-aspartyl-peptidase (threonine type)
MTSRRCAILLASLIFITASASLFAQKPEQSASDSAAYPWAIAIHGGAGESEWEHMDSDTAAAYHDSLAKALAVGSAVLKHNGNALDAVESAVEVLEGDPLFNAGRGSAFAADGTNEMDAALMDGATLAAGSVAAVSATRHPIALARAVMDHTAYATPPNTER